MVWIARSSIARVRAVLAIHPACPLLDKCDVDGVFGERDIAEDAYQSCHRLAVHLTDHAFNICCFPVGGDDRGHASTRPVARNGRTSIGWLVASTTLLAQASAASMSSALMM